MSQGLRRKGTIKGEVFKEGHLNLRHGPLMQAGEAGRGKGLNRLFRNHLFFFGGPKLQGGVCGQGGPHEPARSQSEGACSQRSLDSIMQVTLCN